MSVIKKGGKLKGIEKSHWNYWLGPGQGTRHLISRPERQIKLLSRQCRRIRFRQISFMTLWLVNLYSQTLIHVFLSLCSWVGIERRSRRKNRYVKRSVKFSQDYHIILALLKPARQWYLFMCYFHLGVLCF